MLESTIEIVKLPVLHQDEDPTINDCGIRLFKHSKPGVILDHAGN